MSKIERLARQAAAEWLAVNECNYEEGDPLAEFASRLGDEVTYEAGLAAFARHVARAAVDADRAERERDVVERKTWMRADFEGELEQSEYADDLTPEQFERAVDIAVLSSQARQLADCTDQDWWLVNDAVREAAREVLGR